MVGVTRFQRVFLAARRSLRRCGSLCSARASSAICGLPGRYRTARARTPAEGNRPDHLTSISWSAILLQAEVDRPKCLDDAPPYRQRQLHPMRCDLHIDRARPGAWVRWL